MKSRRGAGLRCFSPGRTTAARAAKDESRRRLANRDGVPVAVWERRL